MKEKEGMLRLYHRKESIAEAAYCSYLGLRQKSYRFEAETGVFFVPENEKETAGLVLYQNHENHLRMEIAKKAGIESFSCCNVYQRNRNESSRSFTAGRDGTTAENTPAMP
ncbi:MAG: hypothetical protein ACLT18_01580 [Blautia sp.]